MTTQPDCECGATRDEHAYLNGHRTFCPSALYRPRQEAFVVTPTMHGITGEQVGFTVEEPDVESPFKVRSFRGNAAEPGTSRPDAPDDEDLFPGMTAFRKRNDEWNAHLARCEAAGLCPGCERPLVAPQPCPACHGNGFVMVGTANSIGNAPCPRGCQLPMTYNAGGTEPQPSASSQPDALSAEEREIANWLLKRHYGLPPQFSEKEQCTVMKALRIAAREPAPQDECEEEWPPVPQQPKIKPYEEPDLEIRDDVPQTWLASRLVAYDERTALALAALDVLEERLDNKSADPVYCYTERQLLAVARKRVYGGKDDG